MRVQRWTEATWAVRGAVRWLGEDGRDGGAVVCGERETEVNRLGRISCLLSVVLGLLATDFPHHSSQFVCCAPLMHPYLGISWHPMARSYPDQDILDILFSDNATRTGLAVESFAQTGAFERRG